MRFQHVDVAEIGECSGIRDDADESDLRAIGRVDAETEGVREGAGDDVAWNPGGPVAPWSGSVDGVDVEPRPGSSEMR